MTLTIEELDKYTTLAIELKRLEEVQRKYEEETENLIEAIREKYKFNEMNVEIIALAQERKVGLDEILSKIDSIRADLIL